MNARRAADRAAEYFNRARPWLRDNAAVVGGMLLTLLYVYNYLAYYALPGNQPAHPEGWWGWWDQAQFLKSTLALVRLNFSADQHWYPLGYALLGVPFAGLLRLRMHPFFFVDLASLLVAYAAFLSFARRAGLPRQWAAALFVLAAAADPVLFLQWVIPWNTTPAGAMLWLLLAVAAAHMAGQRRPMLLGFLAVCVTVLRPTELLLVLPSVIGVLAVDLRGRRLAWIDVARFALGAGVPAVLFALLFIRIYGFQASDYMRASREIGFTLYGLGWKAYVVLIDPHDWFGGGEGLIARCPWLVLGLAGLVPALRRPATAVLAVTLVLHSVLYLAYVDLLPTGLWRSLNVHYWSWTFPGFALLAVLLLRDLAEAATRRPAALALAAAVLALCVRIVPAPAAAGDAVRALDFAAGESLSDSVYFDPVELRDARGTMHNIRQMRAIRFGTGVRVLALTRPFEMPVSIPDAQVGGAVGMPLAEAIEIGLPTWLWRRDAGALGPRR